MGCWPRWDTDCRSGRKIKGKLGLSGGALMNVFITLCEMAVVFILWKEKHTQVACLMRECNGKHHMILHCYCLAHKCSVWCTFFKSYVMTLLLKCFVACQRSPSEFQYLLPCFIRELLICVIVILWSLTGLNAGCVPILTWSIPPFFSSLSSNEGLRFRLYTLKLFKPVWFVQIHDKRELISVIFYW